MSSDRPGGPADVVPGDDSGGEDPQRDDVVGQHAVTGRRSRRARRDRREASAKKGSLLRELPVLLLVAFVLALVVKTFFVQAFFIPSGSMEQTLHGCTGCTGDRVLVNKVPYWFGEPEPGDVVVFKGPDTWTPEVSVAEPGNWVTGALLWLGRAIGVAPPSEDDFVKRVIATEGQTVQCCDPQGGVTVDGEPVEEPYIFENTPVETRAFGPVTVPEGRLWVMGDHRSASADSRSHVGDQYGGTIGVDDVIGKAAVIVWPVSRFGLVDSPDIQGTEAAAAVPSGVTVSSVTASTVAPWAIGLAGAVPVAAWRRGRRPSGD
jgi:signal peptidase I